MNAVLIGAAVLLVTGGALYAAQGGSIPFLAPSLIATEHGWKVGGVEVTRYQNKIMGYNLGFAFPGYVNDADREEVLDFFNKNGCHIYQGGGYPGAPAYAVCDGVTDKATADAKIKDFLPRLNTFMRSL